MWPSPGPPTPKPVEVLLAIGQIRVPAVRVYFGSSKGADTYFVESSTGQNCTPHQSLSLNYCIISPLVCGQNLSVMVTAANTAGPSVPSAEEDFQTCEHLHLTHNINTLLLRTSVLTDSTFLLFLCALISLPHMYCFFWINSK